MGLLGKLVALVVLLIGVGLGYIIYMLDNPPTNVPPPEDVYWGQGQTKKDDETIKPFIINVPNADLVDLKDRLARWRKGAEPLAGVAFQYGFNRNYLQDIVEHWKTKYDWREREKLLNSLAQYKTQISGLDIHFIHVKPDPKTLPKGVEVVPLLLLHGWPGSVKEFYNLIPLLVKHRTSEKFVFEVVAPSLPGYGWSQAASKPGMGPPQMAVIMNKLMKRLGFTKFYVQGGDWGSIVGHNIAAFFPGSVLGFHTNMCIHGSKLTQIKLFLANWFPSMLASDEPYDRMASQLSFLMEETGYLHIQATKPDTVGTGLSDSPVGLAAYILEKFSTWTNNAWKNKPDGGLSNYNKDDLLDNIMIYWTTNSIITSMRLYAEMFNKKQLELSYNNLPLPKTPTGCARFPFELRHVPKKIIEQAYKNLIRFSDMPKGGHFAAFEVPELLAEDIWQFTREARLYHQLEQAKLQREQQEKKNNKQ